MAIDGGTRVCNHLDLTFPNPRLCQKLASYMVRSADHLSWYACEEHSAVPEIVGRELISDFMERLDAHIVEENLGGRGCLQDELDEEQRRAAKLAGLEGSLCPRKR